MVWGRALVYCVVLNLVVSRSILSQSFALTCTVLLCIVLYCSNRPTECKRHQQLTVIKAVDEGGKAKSWGWRVGRQKEESEWNRAGTVGLRILIVSFSKPCATCSRRRRSKGFACLCVCSCVM